VNNNQINHPSHYGGDNPYEAIKVIEGWGFGPGFNLGCAVKYIVRAGEKNQHKLFVKLLKGWPFYYDSEFEDLEKAIWYLKRELQNAKHEHYVHSSIKIQSTFRIKKVIKNWKLNRRREAVVKYIFDAITGEDYLKSLQNAVISLNLELANYGRRL